jgi:hypothetical protein
MNEIKNRRKQIFDNNHFSLALDAIIVLVGNDYPLEHGFSNKAETHFQFK